MALPRCDTWPHAVKTPIRFTPNPPAPNAIRPRSCCSRVRCPLRKSRSTTRPNAWRFMPSVGLRCGRCRRSSSTTSAWAGWRGCRLRWRKSASDTRCRPAPGYWYFAAVMNSLKVSHHTITVLNLAGSTPCGSGTMKLLNVFTSPTRDIWGLRRLKSASVSTNSGDR